MPSSSSGVTISLAPNHTVTSKTASNPRLPSGLVMKPNTTGFDVVKPKTNPGKKKKKTLWLRSIGILNSAQKKHVGQAIICVSSIFLIRHYQNSSQYESYNASVLCVLQTASSIPSTLSTKLGQTYIPG